MTDFSPQSKQLVENGYLDWLCEQLRNLAIDKFDAAPANDSSALSRAKIASELVAEVRQIIISDADRSSLDRKRGRREIGMDRKA